MAEWRDLHAAVYTPGEPPPLGSDLEWAPLDRETDWSVRLWASGALRACAWVTQRSIAVDGRDVLAAGVRGVMTAPAHRRLRYGRMVMADVDELIDSLGVGVALLFSSVVAAPFYGALGWRSVEVPVVCWQPEGPIRYTDRIPAEAPVMIRASEALVPHVLVDVRGLPW
jgi:hypothetical protein